MSLFRSHSGNTENTDPHGWTLPTTFRSWPLVKHSETVIPSRSAFQDVSLLQVTSMVQGHSHTTSYPTPGHIAVHLCLLECFHKMRKDTLTLEGFIFHQQHDTARDAWSVLTRLAIDRFILWHENIEKLLERAAFYGKSGIKNAANNFTKDYLPPLDVLYVWSAYMARPEVYRRHCPKLSPLRMPWDSILEVIDLDTFSYEIPDVAKQLFRTITNQSADIVDYLKSPPGYNQVVSEDLVLDLLEAADIQDTFINRMHSILWIRSPALHGTLQRATARYWQVGKLHSNILPTLAQEDPTIELVWRTHLLYPAAFDEQMNYNTASIKMDSDIEVDCYCWICERIRDATPTYVHKATLELSKEQIASVTADVGFYRYVENFRTTHPAKSPLPTRPFTKEELEHQRREKQKKDEVGYYYGLGYRVEEVRPAIYDKDGKMLKPPKVKVRMDTATRGINSMFAGGGA